MDDFCKYPDLCGVGTDCSECYSAELAAAKARIAELEEAITWAMGKWGNLDAAHSFSLFVLGRGGTGDLSDCLEYWNSVRAAAQLLEKSGD